MISNENLKWFIIFLFSHVWQDSNCRLSVSGMNNCIFKSWHAENQYIVHMYGQILSILIVKYQNWYFKWTIKIVYHLPLRLWMAGLAPQITSLCWNHFNSTQCHAKTQSNLAGHKQNLWILIVKYQNCDFKWKFKMVHYLLI